MDYIIYVLSGISIILALGCFVGYLYSKHIGLLLSSFVSVGFSITAIYLVQWWPLAVGFIINWVLRLMGLDPGYRR